MWRFRQHIITICAFCGTRDFFNERFESAGIDVRATLMREMELMLESIQSESKQSSITTSPKSSETSMKKVGGKKKRQTKIVKTHESIQEQHEEHRDRGPLFHTGPDGSIVMKRLQSKKRSPSVASAKQQYTASTSGSEIMDQKDKINKMGGKKKSKSSTSITATHSTSMTQFSKSGQKSIQSSTGSQVGGHESVVTDLTLSGIKSGMSGTDSKVGSKIQLSTNISGAKTSKTSSSAKSSKTQESMTSEMIISGSKSLAKDKSRLSSSPSSKSISMMASKSQQKQIKSPADKGKTGLKKRSKSTQEITKTMSETLVGTKSGKSLVTSKSSPASDVYGEKEKDKTEKEEKIEEEGKMEKKRDKDQKKVKKLKRKDTKEILIQESQEHLAESGVESKEGKDENREEEEEKKIEKRKMDESKSIESGASGMAFKGFSSDATKKSQKAGTTKLMPSGLSTMKSSKSISATSGESKTGQDEANAERKGKKLKYSKTTETLTTDINFSGAKSALGAQSSVGQKFSSDLAAKKFSSERAKALIDERLSKSSAKSAKSASEINKEDTDSTTSQQLPSSVGGTLSSLRVDSSSDQSDKLLKSKTIKTVKSTTSLAKGSSKSSTTPSPDKVEKNDKKKKKRKKTSKTQERITTTTSETLTGTRGSSGVNSSKSIVGRKSTKSQVGSVTKSAEQQLTPLSDSPLQSPSPSDKGGLQEQEKKKKRKKLKRTKSATTTEIHESETDVHESAAGGSSLTGGSKTDRATLKENKMLSENIAASLSDDKLEKAAEKGKKGKKSTTHEIVTTSETAEITPSDSDVGSKKSAGLRKTSKSGSSITTSPKSLKKNKMKKSILKKGTKETITMQESQGVNIDEIGSRTATPSGKQKEFEKRKGTTRRRTSSSNVSTSDTSESATAGMTTSQSASIAAGRSPSTSSDADGAMTKKGGKKFKRTVKTTRHMTHEQEIEAEHEADEERKRKKKMKQQLSSGGGATTAISESISASEQSDGSPRDKQGEKQHMLRTSTHTLETFKAEQSAVAAEKKQKELEEEEERQRKLKRKLRTTNTERTLTAEQYDEMKRQAEASKSVSGSGITSSTGSSLTGSSMGTTKESSDTGMLKASYSEFKKKKKKNF